MRKLDWPPPPVSGGFGFPLGFVVAIGVTIVAVAAGATAQPVRSVVLLALAVAVISAVTTLPAALATAAVSWGLHDSFVLGRTGGLVFNAGAAGAAVVLVGTAVTVVAIAGTVRMVLARRRSTLPDGPGEGVVAHGNAAEDGESRPPDGGRIKGA
ncbi:hypothetical protein [Amycolatopsis taiwanensis]|uniref:Uncharacterized protein n=1 Tax=Amycolatopsis taiwanensis TaxID=342230 RepID=A0A9W6R567_9PSEU|nr:hypothetical protein [Amycolatopsis taiwanensis]GLY67832.1 hypothetical protein Atai01_44510 [Amycolatopsis taiwanensis]